MCRGGRPGGAQAAGSVPHQASSGAGSASDGVPQVVTLKAGVFAFRGRHIASGLLTPEQPGGGT